MKLPKWAERVIKDRYQRGEALNLSAVKRENPKLIRYLFNPAQFIGWRRALEVCGIPPGKISVELEETVPCRLCEFEGISLMSHLARVHRINKEDYQEQYPGSSILSEVATARRSRMSKRVNGKQLPHWEPLWSPEYALDRLYHYHVRGDSIHFRSMVRLDSKLLFAIYRMFPNYDTALEAIGLSPEAIRQLEHRSWDRAAILQTLKEHARKKQSFGVVEMRKRYGGLLRACASIFGSYEKALEAVRLDPKELIFRRPRIPETLYRKLEADAVRLANGKRDPKRINAFREKYGKYIQKRYGNRTKLAKKLKIPADSLLLT